MKTKGAVGARDKSNRPCRSAEPLPRLGFQDRRSMTGTADIRTGGSRLWRTASPDRSGSGTTLAVNFTDTKASFVSEASVYRLLKDHGLIASPAFILMKAADRFANPTTAPNQLWQTDFTYLKVIGWGWFYLSTVLDDFSRYILASR